MYKLSYKYLSGHPGKSYDETADAKIYLRTGANVNQIKSNQIKSILLV